MGATKKVTREIADFVYKKHKDEGISATKMPKLVEENFNIKIAFDTLRRYCYSSFEKPEVREKQREYKLRYNKKQELKKGEENIFENIRKIEKFLKI